jgi:hypothetical protein
MNEYLITKNTSKEDIYRILKRNGSELILKIGLVNISEPNFIKYRFIYLDNNILFMESEPGKKSLYQIDKYEALNIINASDYIFNKVQSISFENYWSNFIHV